MGIFWSLIKGLNEVLVNSLTCEYNEHESVDEKLVKSLQIDEDKWYKQLHYSTDDEIDRYLERNGLYYNIEHDGRYKCEKVLLDYFIDMNIDVYKI